MINEFATLFAPPGRDLAATLLNFYYCTQDNDQINLTVGKDSNPAIMITSVIKSQCNENRPAILKL